MSDAGEVTGSSENRSWEPGSAMVPTFLNTLSPPTAWAFGLPGSASDGDLPLFVGRGDEGGDPNSESVSPTSVMNASAMIKIKPVRE